MMYDAGPRPEPWMMLAVMAATDELCHELGHGKVNSVCRNLPSILHTIYNTVHKHSGEYHYTNLKKNTLPQTTTTQQHPYCLNTTNVRI